MKGIKRFYKEHRIFTILMAIVIVSTIVIVSVLFKLFGGNGTSKYGPRLDGIEDHIVENDRLDDYRDKLVENGKVKTASIELKGTIFYVKILFEKDSDLTEAEGIALKSLENFSEEELKFYDFQFTLESEANENSNGFLIEGAHNHNGTGLKWGLNRKVEKTETNAVDGD